MLTSPGNVKCDHQRLIALCDSLYSALHCSLVNKEDSGSCLKASVMACFKLHVMNGVCCCRMFVNVSLQVRAIPYIQSWTLSPLGQLDSFYESP